MIVVVAVVVAMMIFRRTVMTATTTSRSNHNTAWPSKGKITRKERSHHADGRRRATSTCMDSTSHCSLKERLDEGGNDKILCSAREERCNEYEKGHSHLRRLVSNECDGSP